jgi:hypothetical protein
VLVEVPELLFLMVDGSGGPNGSQAYQDAVQALFSVSYALKFTVKRSADGMDYGLMPLEGLWWVDDISRFSLDDRTDWRWTLMVLQPAVVTEELLHETVKTSLAKRPLPAVGRLRLEPFEEGRAAQVLHTGPYSAEQPTISRLHAFAQSRGWRSRAGITRSTCRTRPGRPLNGSRRSFANRSDDRIPPVRVSVPGLIGHLARPTGTDRAGGQPTSSSVH